MYLTYEEYQEMIGEEIGCTRAEFLRAESVVESMVRQQTQGRIDSMEVVPEVVKNLVFILLDDVKSLNRDVTSVSNDGYSESYTDSAKIKENIQSLIQTTLSAVTDDNGTPLLYRGINNVLGCCNAL